VGTSHLQLNINHKKLKLQTMSFLYLQKTKCESSIAGFDTPALHAATASADFSAYAGSLSHTFFLLILLPGYHHLMPQSADGSLNLVSHFRFPSPAAHVKKIS
jgi:hypothetical protein